MSINIGVPQDIQNKTAPHENHSVRQFIAFTAYGDPVPKARARTYSRNGKVRTVTPQQTVDYELSVKLAANQAMLYRRPFEGMIRVVIYIYVKIPARMKKQDRARALLGELHPITRPDIDNYIKTILDAMNETVINDDNQVTELVSYKRYSDRPRVDVEVYAI